MWHSQNLAYVTYHTHDTAHSTNAAQGWVEMHDLSCAIQHVPFSVSSLDHLRPHPITTSELANSSHPTNAFHRATPWRWETIFRKFLALKGVDLYCGSAIPALFAEAGLTDVSVTRYMVPYSRWEGLTEEEKAVADFYESFIRGVIPVSIRKAGENAGPEYAEEVEEAVRDAKRYHDAYDGGRNFLWMYVVCGRKPV